VAIHGQVFRAIAAPSRNQSPARRAVRETEFVPSPRIDAKQSRYENFSRRPRHVNLATHPARTNRLDRFAHHDFQRQASYFNWSKRATDPYPPCVPLLCNNSPLRVGHAKPNNSHASPAEPASRRFAPCGFTSATNVNQRSRSPRCLFVVIGCGRRIIGVPGFWRSGAMYSVTFLSPAIGRLRPALEPLAPAYFEFLRMAPYNSRYSDRPPPPPPESTCLSCSPLRSSSVQLRIFPALAVLAPAPSRISSPAPEFCRASGLGPKRHRFRAEPPHLESSGSTSLRESYRTLPSQQISSKNTGPGQSSSSSKALYFFRVGRLHVACRPPHDFRLWPRALRAVSGANRAPAIHPFLRPAH